MFGLFFRFLLDQNVLGAREVIAPWPHVQWQQLMSTVSRKRASRPNRLSTEYTTTFIRDPDGDNTIDNRYT